jgi:hypothetical protein
MWNHVEHFNAATMIPGLLMVCTYFNTHVPLSYTMSYLLFCLCSMVYHMHLAMTSPPRSKFWFSADIVCQHIAAHCHASQWPQKQLITTLLFLTPLYKFRRPWVNVSSAIAIIVANGPYHQVAMCWWLVAFMFFILGKTATPYAHGLFHLAGHMATLSFWRGHSTFKT